jgi:ATP-dependent Lon protease
MADKKTSKYTKTIKKEGDDVKITSVNTNTGASYDKEFHRLLDIKKRIKEKSCYIFVLSFLENAKNGCDSLIGCKRLDSHNKHLIVGIVYNFKHGLEIFLKAFSRSINEKIDKSDQIHDTKRLLENFKKQLSSSRLKKNRTDILKKEINKLEKIIEKYNEVDFLKIYLRDSFSVYDQENTFFKYPEHSVKMIINYSELVNNITKNDILIVKKDIENIIKITKEFRNLLRD